MNVRNKLGETICKIHNFITEVVNLTTKVFKNNTQ